jgi:glucose-1-phosphate thymidylyltransferase
MNFLIEKINQIKKKIPVKAVKVVSNNKFYKDFLDWKTKYNIDAQILNDGSNTPEDRLGAIKDIKFGISGINDDWLILGGDNLFEDNLLGFLNFAFSKKPKPAIAIYDVKKKEFARRYGVVSMADGERIKALEEKPANPLSTLAATCIYFFPKESLKYLDLFLKEEKSLDASGTYIKWLLTKTDIFGYVLKGRWSDIGRIDSLKRAEKEYRMRSTFFQARNAQEKR